jgi:hypothetical protein
MSKQCGSDYGICTKCNTRKASGKMGICCQSCAGGDGDEHSNTCCKLNKNKTIIVSKQCSSDYGLCTKCNLRKASGKMEICCQSCAGGVNDKHSQSCCERNKTKIVSTLSEKTLGLFRLSDHLLTEHDKCCSWNCLNPIYQNISKATSHMALFEFLEHNLTKRIEGQLIKIEEKINSGYIVCLQEVGIILLQKLKDVFNFVVVSTVSKSNFEVIVFPDEIGESRNKSFVYKNGTGQNVQNKSILFSEIMINGSKTLIVNTHIPWSKNDYYQTQLRKTIRDHVRNTFLDSDNANIDEIFLCGDMNTSNIKLFMPYTKYHCQFMKTHVNPEDTFVQIDYAIRINILENFRQKNV